MTQDRALDILKTGANVFLTGEPGAGKTHVINQYTNWLQAAGIPVAITASTGIAATHIGGLTIHSWSAIGTRDTLNNRDIDTILGKEYVVKRLKKAHVLIIDEISMLDGSVLDMVSRILQSARGSSEVFGGLQVVFVGDFYQLPPVNRNNEPIHYAFTANSWQQAKPLVCYLTDQFRHDDELLSGLLKSIRRGDVEESHYTLLSEQQDIDYDIEPTRLFTHNIAVDKLNLEQLTALPGPKKKYQMKHKGNKLLVEGLMRSCLSPQQLVLAEDSMVMCTKNNFEAGYANGTLGRVIGFDAENQMPRIETADGRTLTIQPATWSVMDGGKTLAEIEQIPLRLAWAITVHKSQGMSLDAVEMDLTNAFVFGQGYVALSRVRTLRGLKVLGLNPNALQVDPGIINSDEQFREEARSADQSFADMSDDELEKLQRAFVKARGKSWPSITSDGTVVKVKPKSTYEQTHELLQNGNSIKATAKARTLTEGTIVSHIEWLFDTGVISQAEIETLLPDSIDWVEARRHVYPVLDEQGIEKLKPLYDATDGTFDYLTLRLIRLRYRVEHPTKVGDNSSDK